MGMSIQDILQQLQMAQLGGGAAPGGMALPPIQAMPMPQMSNQDVASMPIPTMRVEGSGLGGAIQRANVGAQNFMGKLGGGLFPVDPTVAASMTPQQIQQTQQQGLLRAGLGLLNAPRGATTGQAIGGALLGAQDATQRQQMQQYALSQREADTQKADARYNQQRADTLGQQATVNARESQELTGKLGYWKGQIEAQKMAAQRYGMASPTEMARLAAEEKRYQRAIELARKGDKLTPEEKYELDFLTGGAVSRVDKADGGGIYPGGGPTQPTPEEIARAMR